MKGSIVLYKEASSKSSAHWQRGDTGKSCERKSEGGGVDQSLKKSKKEKQNTYPLFSVSCQAGARSATTIQCFSSRNRLHQDTKVNANSCSISQTVHCQEGAGFFLETIGLEQCEKFQKGYRSMQILKQCIRTTHCSIDDIHPCKQNHTQAYTEISIKTLMWGNKG